jgi:hypothetical protein
MRRIRAPKDGAPVVLVAGVSTTPMVSAAIALQWDLPSVLAVQHAIDPAREVLVRTVSDITGLIERVEIDVEHACTSCAIREDIVPTLERLAASGTWETIVAQLPVTAEPMQVCRVVEGMPGVAPHTRIVVVGTDEGRDTLEAALRSCLLTDDEIERHGLRWRVPGDGLEPWLGPVDGVSEVA